jgi:hypothetical protein
VRAFLVAMGLLFLIAFIFLLYANHMRGKSVALDDVEISLNQPVVISLPHSGSGWFLGLMEKDRTIDDPSIKLEVSTIDGTIGEGRVTKIPYVDPASMQTYIITKRSTTVYNGPLSDLVRGEYQIIFSCKYTTTWQFVMTSSAASLEPLKVILSFVSPEGG